MDNWHDSRIGQIQQFKAQEAQRKLAKLAEEEAKRQKLQREVEARQGGREEEAKRQKPQAASRQPRATNKAGYCVACDGLVSFEAQNCPHCGQPDAGKRALEAKELQKLTNLNLVNTQITDAGLKQVAKMQQLDELDLNDTQITDAGLKEVAKLQKLETLWVSDTQVTEAGVAELKKALPSCKIEGP